VVKGLVAAALVSGAGHVAAEEYCRTPYLYATNIRTACEQYGTNGLSGLYSSSRFINGLLHPVHKSPKGLSR